MKQGNEGKTYSKIRFALAENLRPDLKEISPKQAGLVAVLFSVHSMPQYEIVGVDSPTTFLKQMAVESGISQKQLNEAFKRGKETQ